MVFATLTPPLPPWSSFDIMPLITHLIQGGPKGGPGLK